MKKEYDWIANKRNNRNKRKQQSRNTQQNKSPRCERKRVHRMTLKENSRERGSLSGY